MIPKHLHVLAGSLIRLDCLQQGDDPRLHVLFAAHIALFFISFLLLFFLHGLRSKAQIQVTSRKVDEVASFGTEISETKI